MFFLKSACHGVLAASKALLRSSCGVLSRSYGVLVGDSMRSHDAFTALSRCSHCVHCAVMAFALCSHGVCTALMAWHLKSMQISGTVAIRIIIQPSKPKRGITTCVILKIVKIRENILYCQPSEYLFLKKVATQQLKLN